MSRRLHLYLAQHYAASLALCLLSLVGLLVGTTLVEHAASLASQAEGPASLGRLSWAAAVKVAYQNFPVAAFLAAILCGASLARRGELLAIEANGMGPYQTMVPLCAVAAVGALGCFALGEWVMPAAVVQTRQSMGSLRSEAGPSQSSRSPWFMDGDYVLYLPEVDQAQQTFWQPTVYALQDGRLQALIEARSLRHAGDWVLEGAARRFVDRPEVERLDRLVLPLRVRPQDLLDSTGDPQLLSLGELRALIGRRRRAGYDVTLHRLEAQQRLAQPLSGCLLVMLALPFALRPRQPRLGRALGSGVGLLCAYLAAQQGCRLMATSQSMPAWWGAWGAPLGAVGVALIQRLRGV
jgi:LPS export ABC transporter permease LptG